MMTDPIADMLTRIRNALRIRQNIVKIPYSRIKKGIAETLHREGYIGGWKEEGEGIHRVLVVDLKYGSDGEAVLSKMQRESRPGRRLYAGASEIRPVLNGLGISIVSTSKGILSDRECRDQRVGGEVLCSIY